MKYSYAYKTSDGTRHEDSMEASSREAVFEALRAKGIRPIKVVAADGSKANGAGVSIKRYVVLIIVLVVALVGLLVYQAIVTSKEEPNYVFNSTARRQVVGDAAIVDKGILTGWSEVFPQEGERFFASFAIPGVKAAQRNTTVAEILLSLERSMPPEANDSIEARQIKAMVEGMKAEARRYVAAGGSIVEYGKRLTERQDAEIAIYERAKSEIEKASKSFSETELMKLWESRNDQLRNLGIKLVAFPD